jgi:uncharacterized protein (DUF433 family)
MVSYIRGRRRRLSDEEIVALYVGGLDSGTIAIQAGCDATTVLDLVRKAGGTVRPTGGRARIDRHRITDAEICRRYRDGQSGPMIADAAACNASSVYNILRRYNVPLRDSRQVTRAANAAARNQRLRGRPAYPE